MKLDQTKITIRERSLGELLDLAFRLTVYYFKPLSFATLLLVVPFAIFNWWMTYPIIEFDNSADSNWQCISLMSLLVFLEAPFVTIYTTLFLGRMMFLQEISYRSLLKDGWQLLIRTYSFRLIARGGAVGVLFLFFVLDRESSDGFVLLVILCIALAVIRACRPFVNEIILLERNPIRSHNPEVITIGRRSRFLHRPSGNELVAAWLLMAFVCLVAGLSILSSFWFVNGVVFGQWKIGQILLQVYAPLTLWLMVLFSAVVKFLLYLDLRIRREGWEVELKVRAAATELKEQLV